MKHKGIKLIIPFFVAIFIILQSIGIQAFAETKTSSEELPDISGAIYIQDHANIFTEEEKDSIRKMGKEIEEMTSAQMMVYTVDSIGEEDPMEYALNVHRYYEIGTEDKDNGLVILYAKKEKKIQVSVGYGLEGVLNDGKVGRILDTYLKKGAKEKEITSGIVNIYKDMSGKIQKEYEENGELGEYDAQGDGEEDNSIQIPTWAIILTVVVVIILIIIDLRVTGGFFTEFLLHILFFVLRLFGNNNNNGSGGGGSAGGGGAGRGL